MPNFHKPSYVQDSTHFEGSSPSKPISILVSSSSSSSSFFIKRERRKEEKQVTIGFGKDEP